jgi:hypothetical protein
MDVKESLLRQVAEAVILGFKENGIDAEIEDRAGKKRDPDRDYVSIIWKDSKVTWQSHARISLIWHDAEDDDSETLVRIEYG